MPTLEQLDAAMLQPAQFVPAIQQFGGGSLTLTDDERPWRVVGKDAAVYQLTTTDGRRLAIRCPFEDTFAARSADVYTALARGGGVAVHAVSDLLARPVAFEPRGLSVPRDGLRSSAFSVIIMEWIEGKTLRQAVGQACSSDDHEALETLARSWLNSVERFNKARFIHGDLSDQNILVDPNGRIRLVDLDTCSWPGSPPAPVLFGTAGYVHPRANTKTTGPNRDAFAALVIGVSLTALSQLPGVRRHSGREQSGLLFSAWDIAHLGTSPVFADLIATARPSLRAAGEALLRASEGTPNDVQDTTRTGMQHLHLALQPAEKRSAPKADPSALTRNRDVERFKERWKGGGGQSVSSGKDRGDTRGRTEDVQRLKVALNAGEDALVASLWPGVRGDDRLSHQAIMIADVLQRFHGKAVADALREGHDQRLVDSIRDAEASGVAVTASTRRADRQARRRIGLRERLRFATEGEDSRLLAELNGSPDLQELEADGTVSNVSEMAERAERRTRLHRALRANDDAAIVEAWDPAISSRDSHIRGEARHRIDLAIRRRQWLASARAALKSRDAAQLAELLGDAPEDTLSQLSAVERNRIDRAIERMSASVNLEEAIEIGSRETILDAMNRLMASGATLPETLDWAKVRDVADRESLVRAIRESSGGPRPNYDRLALLLPAARAAAADSPFLEDDIDVEALERAVLRDDYLRRLRSAMATSNDEAIAAAAGPDPFGALASLTVEERDHINAVLRRLGKRQITAPKAS